jgi:hypothetical protein
MKLLSADDLSNTAASTLKDAEDIHREVKKIPASRVLRKRVVLETILKHVGDFADTNPVLARNLLDTVREIRPTVDTVSATSYVPRIDK